MNGLSNSKKIASFSAILIMLFSINCIGQPVPQKVKDAFAQKFPNAQDVEWEKESDTEYEVVFMLNNLDHSANFNDKGNWLETEAEISRQDLPDAVLATLARDYWDSDIQEIAKITTSKETLYEVEIRVDHEEDEDGEAEEHEEDDDQYELMVQKEEEILRELGMLPGFSSSKEI
jgi:hypothetical protein